MSGSAQITTRSILILLSISLHACVVVTPKKVASYDKKCKVATQKIELTLEQAQTYNDLHCTNGDCTLDFAQALIESAFTTASSAIASGSVAIVGNTLYWLESQGECPNKVQSEQHPPNKQPLQQDEKYFITEEIVKAKS